MRTDPVTRIEYDVLDSVVSAMVASPDDAYWARRLVDLVRDPMTAERLRPHLVTAVTRWAAQDPSFFVHEHYLSEQLAIWAWPRALLEDLDAALSVGEASITHFVMGRLWLAARRPSEDMPDFYARAARHLREVDVEDRIGVWHEAMCEALGVADPDGLEQEATAILDSAAPGARDRALLAILRGAARAANWDLYDTHRRAYGAFDPEGVIRMGSEISRLDGMRAEHQLGFGRTSTLRAPASKGDSTSIHEASTLRPPSRAAQAPIRRRAPSRA